MLKSTTFPEKTKLFNLNLEAHNDIFINIYQFPIEGPNHPLYKSQSHHAFITQLFRCKIF